MRSLGQRLGGRREEGSPWFCVQLRHDWLRHYIVIHLYQSLLLITINRALLNKRHFYLFPRKRVSREEEGERKSGAKQQHKQQQA